MTPEAAVARVGPGRTPRRRGPWRHGLEEAMVARLVTAAERRSRFVARVVAAAALACAAPLRAQEPADGAAAAEDSVWAAVLDSYVVPDTQHLVVRARTREGIEDRSWMAGAATESRIPGIERETGEDFWARNLRPRAIGPLPRTRVSVVLAADATLDSLSRGPDGSDGPQYFWSAFYRRFPGANSLVDFSRVGFNAARTQAVVYVSRSCGGLCGTGQMVLLTRKPDGSWRVARIGHLWVS